MNKVASSIIASVVVLSVVFFLGRLLLLSGLQKEIMQASNRLAQYEDNKNILEAKLNKWRKKINADPVKMPRSSKILLPGQEYQLLDSIIKFSGNMKIQDFELMNSYFVKNKDEEENMMSSASFNPGEELPQLDDQGMPVGLSVEEDIEWPGVEIIPVKFTFTTTYRNLGKFFSEVTKNLPICTVRSMDLLLKDSGIAKGTLVVLFPVSEK
jgi:hypothetical protein